MAAVGGGRLLTNFDGYSTTFNGIEVSMNKRMSNRWMMRLAGGVQQPDRSTTTWRSRSTENGNPTRSDIFPLINGGQWAPRSAGSGSGDVFVNQRWNFNVNGAYQLPWDMEVAGNLFGKQGTPYPYFRQRGARPRRHGAHPRSTSELDAIRFDNLWNLDLRWAKNAQVRRPRDSAVHRRPVQRDEQRHGNHA